MLASVVSEAHKVAVVWKKEKKSDLESLTVKYVFPTWLRPQPMQSRCIRSLFTPQNSIIKWYHKVTYTKLTNDKPTATQTAHIIPSHGEGFEPGDVGRAPFVELIPDPLVFDADPLVVGRANPVVAVPLPVLVPVPTDVVLTTDVTAVLARPQAPTTADKSFTFLRAAGVEPQLAACVIHIESVSRSKTAA